MTPFGRQMSSLVLISAGAAYGLMGRAKAADPKFPVPSHPNVDGRFARYLESPDGSVDGVVLENGAVARFPPHPRADEHPPLRPGDRVRVQGDVVSGVRGPYLVHALVTRGSLPIAPGAITPPPPTKPETSDARSQRGERRVSTGAKASRVASVQPVPGTSKVRDQSAGRQGQVANILFVQSQRARARRQGRLETLESQTRSVTTGTGQRNRNSQWSRTQETAGP